MQWNCRELVNKTIQSVCQMCQKDQFTKSKHFHCNMKTTIRTSKCMHINSFFLKTRYQETEEHVAGQDGLRNRNWRKIQSLSGVKKKSRKQA